MSDRVITWIDTGVTSGVTRRNAYYPCRRGPYKIGVRMGPVEVTTERGVMTATLVDVANRNALGADLVAGLRDALAAANADPAIRALVVHGDDGLDELTTTGSSHAALVADAAVTSMRIDPSSLGLARASASDLAGYPLARRHRSAFE